MVGSAVIESVLAFFQSLSSFAILVGLASLAFAVWAHRRNRIATELQGITIRPGQSHPTQDFDDKPPITWFTPSIIATGPGIRYGVHTMFWEDDSMLDQSMWAPDKRSRFDSESKPLTGELEVPVSLVPHLWFGVGWDEVHRGGLRPNFTRINLSTHELQVFTWSRSLRLHRWWCEQHWARRLGGGVQKPAGKWIPLLGGQLKPWQYPY